MRQNLAEEREIHRENLVSLIAPHLLQATSATDVSAIESPLHRHETKLMLFVLQVLVQIQMASTHNSAVKGRTCIRRKNKENLLMYVAKGLQSTASSYLWSLNNNDTSFTTLWFSSRWSWDSKLHQVESIKDWT